MIREGARRAMRQLERSERLVLVGYEGALKGDSRRLRADWGYLLEVLRDKKEVLEVVIRSYRVRKVGRAARGS